MFLKKKKKKKKKKKSCPQLPFTPSHGVKHRSHQFATRQLVRESYCFTMVIFSISAHISLHTLHISVN